MYVNKEHQFVLKELTRLTGDVWRVGKRREYPTLFRGELIITQGEAEVKARINQLKREHGIYLND